MDQKGQNIPDLDRVRDGDGPGVLMVGCGGLGLDEQLRVVVGPAVPGGAHGRAGPGVAGGQAGLAAAPRHLRRGQGRQVQGQQAAEKRRHCEKDEFMNGYVFNQNGYHIFSWKGGKWF